MVVSNAILSVKVSASSTTGIFFDDLIFLGGRLISFVSSILVCSDTVGASLFVKDSYGSNCLFFLGDLGEEFSSTFLIRRD
jgi:hypothetical protein